MYRRKMLERNGNVQNLKKTPKRNINKISNMEPARYVMYFAGFFVL